MIPLIPSWADKYVDYWETIRRRNLWLIELRYGAVIVLFGFLILSELILGLSFSATQNRILFIINLVILLYNFFLHWVRKYLKCIPGKFNPLHFSLVQMLLDMTALSLIVYYTGSIETPLFMLFVFHMIIGSLILPGRIMYAIAAGTILIFNGAVFGEYLRIIPHHNVNGLLEAPLYTNLKFIISYDVVFSFVMLVSVFLANKLAMQLYRIEQQLIESFDRLKSAETEKQKYIIGIVHEIKSPLAVVHSYLDVILNKFLGPVNPAIEHRLTRAKASSSEAIQMINDVLKISKLRLLDEISNDDIELSKLLAETVGKLSVELKRKEIAIKFSDCRETKKKIKGDRFLLEIAFSNLLGNSIKYVEKKGEVEIIIKEDKRDIIIEFRDNGIGIPEKDLDKIFNDFYRASNIRQKEYEGSGLGLSIVKQIIERHGGRIHAESPSRLGTSSNPGASFIVELPENIYSEK